MKDKSYLFCNGILTNPNDVNGWTDRAEAWIEKETPYNADKFEYFSGALTRRLYQNDRVEKVITIARRMTPMNLVLVGHSNGCDIIQRVVQREKFKIKELHLIAAASEHDFEKNGFNKALIKGTVEQIFCYCSPKDGALQKAKLSNIFNFLGLGYGYLGLVGPSRVAESVKDRVTCIWRNIDHSDWFNKKYFPLTMKQIVHAA